MPQVNLNLTNELLLRVDQARGLVNRTAWLRSAIEEKLAKPSIINEPMVPTSILLDADEARRLAKESVPRETVHKPLAGGVIHSPGDHPMPEVTTPTADYLAAKEQARAIAAKNCSHPDSSRMGDRCGICGWAL